MSTAYNKTRSHLKEEAAWVGACIILTEYSKEIESYTQRIALHGTGHVVVLLGDKDKGNLQRYEYRLPDEETSRFFRLAQEQDILSAQSPPQAERLTVWVSIEFSIKNVDDGFELVDKYGHIEHPVFDAFYNEFIKLKDKTKDLQPIRHDPYPWYIARRGLSGGRISLFKSLREIRRLQYADIPGALGKVALTFIFSIPALILISILLAIAYYAAPIASDYTYGFGSGILHGVFAIPNAAIGLVDGRPTRAPLNTGFTYGFGFFIGLVVIPMLLEIAVTVVDFFRKGN